MDLPYRAEYSKSNRSKFQSPFFDGKQPNWFHFDCFFVKQRVRTTDDIEHYESLRIGDQDRIKSHICSTSAVLPDENGKAKGKKRPADKAAEKSKKQALRDFQIEKAKSSRSTCRGCEQKILKDEVRVSKKEFESETSKQIGGVPQWHHLSCFAELRAQLGFFESASKIPGFENLNKSEKEEALEAIPAIKQESIPDVKKLKLEEDPQDKIYRKQNKIMFGYRDDLKQLSKPDLTLLLQENEQEIPAGVERMLDRISDIITFGALKRCEECMNGQLVFNKVGYICTGHLNEWTKCSAIIKTPERKKFKVPKELKEKYPFLKKYKFVAGERVVKDINPSVPVKKVVQDEVDGQPKVIRALPALYDMEFVILGQPERGKDVLKKQIEALGGKVVTKISKKNMAVIASKEMVEKKGSRLKDAESEQIQVVSEDFVDEAKENSGKIPELILNKSICDWGSDPKTRMPAPRSSSSKADMKSKSRFTSTVPSKIKLTIKGGSTVDPESGLEDIAHVYRSGKNDRWTSVLGLTDVHKNKNSYYKLQLLESDKGCRYWVYRGWGRIGTTIGGNKTEEFDTLFDAKSHFEELYEERTANSWHDRHNFKKVPGKMYPIDIDYSSEETENLDIVDADSKLPVQVQDLIKLIFDVRQMKKLMLEFELDTEKMPLGKLSKAQIQKAYAVLSELQAIVETGCNESKLVEATNRFYTLIPHSFGIDQVPILRDTDIIKQKLEMIDSLMEMQVAYNLMKSGTEHTVDSYYKQLNTEIDILDKNGEEFSIIHEYVKNTHATTHDNYDLDVQEVFVVKRHGEDKRYKPFRKLPNRKLLWHGSRITNFVGILSQGLRIAPPEAPVTGYMFGKGVYFADMVSKSANYCCASPQNSTGLLLLCEVALGNMLKKMHAENVTKLPKGHHSVKGVGKTHPDPSFVKKIKDVEVPVGKGVSVPEHQESSLLYNEYIVYDVAQVQIKYLIKVDFKYKY
ncbi:hypothetical protein ABEB36_001606 [Hypothenemus hampei]|uniref:Poly [ADP-ribose] polymerase n=1 Tax=Hypothenemus hampei TaxID=57062 RepID=A0ABD1FF44_HYPHA